MVNDIELLDALHKGNQYVKKLHDIIAQATFAMAVEEIGRWKSDIYRNK